MYEWNDNLLLPVQSLKRFQKINTAVQYADDFNTYNSILFFLLLVLTILDVMPVKTCFPIIQRRDS